MENGELGSKNGSTPAFSVSTAYTGTPSTGLEWAALLARLRRRGQAMPVKDSLIATTALVHGLTMVTRNRSDFVKSGVTVIDPFER